MMASTSLGSHVESENMDAPGQVCSENTLGNIVDDRPHELQSKHKVFLSHSGAQKDFVEQLCVDLERCDRYPFLDKLRSSLPIGEKFPKLIFDAIEQCQVGVVILSEEFFVKSKWPILELNAMVKEFERPNSRIRIIPVFYLISMDAFKDEKSHSRWTSQWEKWALSDKRINVGEWKKALRVLGSINGLVLKEGHGDVKFREEIVAEVCRFVPVKTRWDDSHVQGRARSCKVIQDKMDQVTSLSKVCIVGLYGVGGIGKTTISKALCNELSSKFCDKVCHIELGSKSEMALLQSALKKLTNIRHDVLDELDDVGEGYAYLKDKLCSEPIFMVVDNVQDDFNTIDVAQRILRVGSRCGNVLLVTARSLEILKRLNLDKANCLEMPDLEEDEAKSLFLTCANQAVDYKVDGALVKDCIERCNFLRGDGQRRHYHPLALKVLGQHLGCDTTQWPKKLDMIKRFSELGDRENPIFPIFKRSFDSLHIDHQRIFMDLALITGSNRCDINFLLDNGDSRQDWLCMVHDCSIEVIHHTLEVLKRNALLEELSDDFITIGMHDLWIEFAIVETKSPNFKDVRWVYHADGNRGTLGRRGQCRESVERMCFLEAGCKSLNGEQLDDFVNVEAFVLNVDIYLQDCTLDLDLSGLKYLKSLYLSTPGLAVLRADGLSSLTNLCFLAWHTPRFSPCFSEIGHMTKLRFLFLLDCKGVEVLDLSKLKLLQVVRLEDFPDLITISGLSSELANLQVLRIENCMSLLKCPGLDELYALEVLRIEDCGKLEELPNLGRLINLRELRIIGCKCIAMVSGLDDLVALEALDAEGCTSLFLLPDLGKLTRLRELDIRKCPVQEVSGMDGLVALTTLSASFDQLLTAWQLVFPKLALLKVLEIHGWKGPIWTIVLNLSLLETLRLICCEGNDMDVPDLHNLERLNSVFLEDCNVKDLSGLSNLSALESLGVYDCETLERLPELENLSKLTCLGIWGCENLRHWPSSSNLCLRKLHVDEFALMSIAPDHETLAGLRHLTIYRLQRADALFLASLSHLEVLDLRLSSTIEKFDVSDFSQVKDLRLKYNTALTRLSCDTPLTALTELTISGCGMLVEMPDLSMFPHLEDLKIKNGRALKRLSCSSPLTAMKIIQLIGCDPEIETPDLKWFPNLIKFRVREDRSMI